jgi:predicted TIM-barrel fold metal-dependent hydrolase
MSLFKHLSLLALLAVSGWAISNNMAEETTQQLPIIDCHVHFYDIKRTEGVTWIKPDNKTLYRSHSPSDYTATAKAAGVTGVVIVQAGQHLPDNQWNLDQCKADPNFYHGIVGNLSKVIGTAEFRSLFDELCKSKHFLGYRLSGRYQPELTQQFWDDLAYTAEKQRSVDVLANEYSLDDVQLIAKRVPKLKLILNHFGNVTLNDQQLPAEWVKSFREVAKQPNVYCKVSALFGRVKQQPAPTELKFYQPILDLAYESFGPDRLIYGSDWPVSNTTAEYATVVQLTKSYFTPKGTKVMRQVFSENAKAFYGIETVK